MVRKESKSRRTTAMTIPLHCPLAAAILLVFGHAGAAIIDVDIGGDAHVSGHCIRAIASANTHAAPADTNCARGATGGNTIAVPPSLSPIELTGAALDIADTGGTTLIHSTVSGTQVAVRRASRSERYSARASRPRSRILRSRATRHDDRRRHRRRQHERHVAALLGARQCLAILQRRHHH
jgi:type IV secretory pathway TrbL component